MRFVSADPIGFDGGLNWYAYCGGNPVMFFDPRGLGPWDWVSNGIAVAGGALQFVGGAAIIATTGWTGIGAVAGVYLMASGAASFGAGVVNMYDLANDRPATLNNSGLFGLGTSLLTDSPQANVVASGIDVTLNLATGVVGLRAAGTAVMEAAQTGTITRAVADMNCSGTISSARTLWSAEEVVEKVGPTVIRMPAAADAFTTLGVGATTIDTGINLSRDPNSGCRR
jgi:hypothetical protein